MRANAACSGQRPDAASESQCENTLLLAFEDMCERAMHMHEQSVGQVVWLFGTVVFALPRSFVNMQLVICVLACVCATAFGADSLPRLVVEYDAATQGARVAAEASFAKRAAQLAARLERSSGEVSKVREATARWLHGSSQGASSFLASKLQPVDASGIRQGLAATEPMLSSAPAVVNVIMREDVAAMGRQRQVQSKIAEVTPGLERDLDAGAAL